MLCTMNTQTSPETRDKRGSFVTTYSGARFFVDECNIQDIPIEDIAHALSMNCRFNGHLEKFYSVAEHSVIVSELVSDEDALSALLHDVSEAFVPDMPRPFKCMIEGFDAYEERIQKAVAEHYGTKYPLPEHVQWVDKNIVRTEAEELYKSPPSWVEYYDQVCLKGMIVGHPPKIAKEIFLAEFYRLTS